MGPEQIDHINIVNWFNHNYPELADDLHHFANERLCSIQQGRLLKRMAVKKGVADFFLGVACGPFHGMWLELKSGKGKLSKEQSEFINRKRERGYFAIAAWGADEAKETILTYLNSSTTNCFFNTPKNCS
jgi:hypothetical protein